MSAVRLKSISELKNFVQKNFSALVQPRQILLLKGEMGAGKTEFVKQLVALAGGDAATSPSFALHNTYVASGLSIEHLDLYRLETEDDLQSIGFWDLFENENALIVIEWADRVAVQKFPMTWKKINLKFKVLDETTREITFEP